jgi:hypothetical protein
VKREESKDDDGGGAADGWVEYAVAIGVGLGAGLLLKLLKGGGIGIDLSLPRLPKLPKLKLRPQRRGRAAPLAGPPMDPLSGVVGPLALCSAWSASVSVGRLVPHSSVVKGWLLG